MRKIITVLFTLFLSVNLYVLANGVAIVDAKSPSYLKLISTNVNVVVENQVAIVTSRQIFRNDNYDSTLFKFAFPMPEGASATELSWFINGRWEKANISAQPQDTTLPSGNGGDINANLKEYLGDLPLYFNIKNGIKRDSIITVQLKYVQLLKYDFGNVGFVYPNNYSLIQSTNDIDQYFSFNLTSGRTIDDIQLISHTPKQTQNNSNDALVIYESSSIAADKNFEVNYSLTTTEFGLFGFSTMLNDSIVYDKENGSGYFTFVVEPNPSDNSAIIEKIFTLVIDKSGSMGSQKMMQARDAASFIINNLNPDDKFNIIDFETNVNSFRSTHVVNSTENRNYALNYISGLNAAGGTNISGALSTAISQFASTSNSTANIIIFFTDGQASSGITGTPEILEHVNSEVQKHETEIKLFSFGIGTGANKQLLTLLSSQNNGISQFLGNDELEESITQFYLNIQNPVLLGTTISFSSEAITEVYPNPLPSLYKGQQMIVSGRYTNPVNTEIILNGHALGEAVEYRYELSLSDSTIEKNHFLTKIWAKQKIENLFVKYYSLDSYSPKADSLKEEILTISLAYGIITEFTSFTDESHLTDVEESLVLENDEMIKKDFHLFGNYPNPFNPSTNIKFSVGKHLAGKIYLRIFNSLGQLVRVIEVNVNGQGIYEVTWNGLFETGEVAPSGIYVYSIDFGNTLLSGKMMLLK